MGNLLLNSLEIRNFRGFRHLQIERLGRVNLIVGKNNVGKSSLLEALEFFARRGALRLIWEFLGTRDERVQSEVNIESMLEALAYLFYGRESIGPHTEPIQIGPINSAEESLIFSMGWSTLEIDEEGRRNIRPLQPDEYDIVENLIPRVEIQNRHSTLSYPLDPAFLNIPLRSEIKEINCVSITANGMDRRQIGRLWDNISLTDLEKDIVASLRIIAPGIEGLNLVEDPASIQRRFPIVKITGSARRLPLGSLGNGMQRMFGIALALTNAKDGLLLIDEIENGIHYSVQQELWQLIFRLAHCLNIQVFATTHSWDCIEAFQKAAQEDKQEEGMLIRLELKKDEVATTLFDERRLGIATREQIEVR